jgi:hypothetical protein
MSQQSAPRDTPLIAQCPLRCHSHTFLVPAMPGTGRDRLELPDDGKAGHGLHTACLSPPSCACASRRVVQRRRRTGVNSKRSSSPGKVRLRRHYALQSVIGRQRVNASGSEKLTIRPFTGFAYVRHSSSLRAIRNSHSSWSTSFSPWQCLA